MFSVITKLQKLEYEQVAEEKLKKKKYIKLSQEDFKEEQINKLKIYLKVTKHYHDIKKLVIDLRLLNKKELFNESYTAFKVGFMNYVIVGTDYWEQMCKEGYSKIEK